MSAKPGAENSHAREQRVLILAPTKRDGEISAALLGHDQIKTLVCHTSAQVADELKLGAGALILTEDALFNPHNGPLHEALTNQPTWSELPVIALVRNSTDGAIDKELKHFSHVTLLERPVLLRTFVSAVKTALWARQRQYVNRDLLVKERLAREEAEQNSRLKDEFIATLSHELRTPLSAILGWSQLLGHGLLGPEEVQEAVSSIERNARAQTQLIEDLLDMSRIVSGKMRLDVQLLEPAAFIQGAIATIRPAAAAKEIAVTTEFDEQPGTVLGDPSRLQQVIWNLLSNAIKFTPQGGEVRVILKRLNSHLEIQIVDTGQGISADFLPYVFDRFRQADGSTTRRVGGLGIGLAIVKQLVELHGGSVEARSNGNDCGSTFVVTLPVNSTVFKASETRRGSNRFALDSLRETAKLPSLVGLKILAVDDEPDALAIIAHVLKLCGAEVRTAPSARGALDIVKDFHPDVFISDIGMPEMDGHELIERIHAMAGTLPAIALTAYARTEDHSRSLRAGFTAHINKPVEPAELVATVVAVAGKP